MTMKDTLKKQRRGALLVLGAVALAVIITVALASEYSEHWGGQPTAAVNQPMELRGSWLGMRLAEADSPTARELGVPPKVRGVVVAEVAPGGASRASTAGLLPGDVVVQVDGKDVEDLEQLHDLTARLDVARPLPMQILRQGHPFALVVPPPANLGFQPAAVTPVGLQTPATTFVGPNGCVRSAPGGQGASRLYPRWGAR